MRIFAKDAVFLGIDYQERLLPAIFEREKVVANSIRLIRGLTALKIPMIFTAQYPKGLGNNTAEILAAASGVPEIAKMAFSAFFEDACRRAVKKTGKKTAIIAGVEAHVCVLQTVLDLRAAGYTVALVADCVGSRTVQNRDYGIERMRDEGAVITTYESILFECLTTAENPAFKAVSKIVK